ncbi:MAG: ribulose-phosphate 3-epimerase [Oscillospiraceae bacterium]|jgi:ribulose-phosphate 3-epimerase|nr:ribulose-phosphate 3-epimerase [Oscillospiraceae bacterium]
MNNYGGELRGRLVAPSVLSADFLRLGAQLAAMPNADMIHLDVMDGHFVPNLSLGLPILEALRRFDAKLVIDCHLMIDNPLQYAEKFALAGANIVTVHVEAASAPELRKVFAEIRAAGAAAGLSLKPGTPVTALFPYLAEVGVALVMAVEPGFGGQSFQNSALEKIRALREFADVNKLNCKIEVDGGINPETAAKCRSAGADILVAGNYVFGSGDLSAAIENIRGA